ncbi:MAG: hypothetical protein JST30_02815 [Armatimonadetes bacterium]|nr:hypothetical protein [Armatimonadota bacterium]
MIIRATLLLGAALGTCAAAHAETRAIEGHGFAKNRANQTIRFDMAVSQVDDAAAQGRIEFKWRNGAREVTVTCARPNGVRVGPREARTSGRAVMTVRANGNTVKTEGEVFVAAFDSADNAHRDRVRFRFVRDPFGSPEGDFFFEGEVVDGNIVVRKS